MQALFNMSMALAPCHNGPIHATPSSSTLSVHQLKSMKSTQGMILRMAGNWPWLYTEGGADVDRLENL